MTLVVLGGVVWGGKTASTFMAKASVCPAQKVGAVQVTANSAVVSWETADSSAGKVEYGTNATNLTFSQIEASSGKTHNVPLTLLTPNTVYYYLVTIGKSKCDFSGQTCDKSCVPWSFTTAAVTPQSEVIVTIPPSPMLSPSRTVSPAVSLSVSSGTPSGGLSAFCTKVQLNLGKSSRDATSWAALKQYDIDSNGVVNGLDIIKCQKAGK